MIGPEEVLSYWFPEEDISSADAETFGWRMEWWFDGGPAVDREISARFGGVLERARRGELDHWAQTPRGRLALIIVLDQFSRNAYRGTPLAYAQDPAALKLALEGIDAGMDRGFSFMERMFLAMPLGHSEDLALQERAVRYTEEMAGRMPLRLWARFEFRLWQARGHRDEIARFGRFPHRNEALGRASTPEEAEYLRDEGPVYMRRPPEGVADRS